MKEFITKKTPGGVVHGFFSALMKLFVYLIVCAVCILGYQQYQAFQEAKKPKLKSDQALAWHPKPKDYVPERVHHTSEAQPAVPEGTYLPSDNDFERGNTAALVRRESYKALGGGARFKRAQGLDAAGVGAGGGSLSNGVLNSVGPPVTDSSPQVGKGGLGNLQPLKSASRGELLKDRATLEKEILAKEASQEAATEARYRFWQIMGVCLAIGLLIFFWLVSFSTD
jgi:hypothetical protein